MEESLSIHTGTRLSYSVHVPCPVPTDDPFGRGHRGDYLAPPACRTSGSIGSEWARNGKFWISFVGQRFARSARVILSIPLTCASGLDVDHILVSRLGHSPQETGVLLDGYFGTVVSCTVQHTMQEPLRYPRSIR